MEAENQTQWQEPFPPEKIVRESHEMSEAATIANIFLEPGRTFEDLRKKPRFVIGSLIIALLITGYSFGLYYKIGDAAIRRTIVEQMDKNPQVASMSPEQKEAAVNMNLTIGSVVRYALPFIILISLLIGGLCYWLGAKAFGGNGGFLHGLSVWIYSSIPPTILSIVASFIIMFFKSADEIDLNSSQRGLLHANPGVFFGTDSSAVLVTLISTLDLLAIWGWVLAAIGLRITNKLSSGSAWAITIIFALIGVTMRVVGAYFSGNPS